MHLPPTLPIIVQCNNTEYKVHSASDDVNITTTTIIIVIIIIVAAYKRNKKKVRIPHNYNISDWDPYPGSHWTKIIIIIIVESFSFIYFTFNRSNESHTDCIPSRYQHFQMQLLDRNSSLIKIMNSELNFSNINKIKNWLALATFHRFV